MGWGWLNHFLVCRAWGCCCVSCIQQQHHTSRNLSVTCVVCAFCHVCGLVGMRWNGNPRFRLGMLRAMTLANPVEGLGFFGECAACLNLDHHPGRPLWSTILISGCSTVIQCAVMRRNRRQAQGCCNSHRKFTKQPQVTPVTKLHICQPSRLVHNMHTTTHSTLCSRFGCHVFSQSTCAARCQASQCLLSLGPPHCVG